MIIIHDVDKSVLPRALEKPLSAALRSAPVVILTGARQTGKSTLAKQYQTEGRPYLTLDDLDILEQAKTAPDSLVERDKALILDEVQRSPELLLAVKRVVDKKRSAGRFLLTGSANLLLLKRVADTLAGRAVYFTLWPLSRGEQLGRGETGPWGALFSAPDTDWPEVLRGSRLPRADWMDLAKRGGYPVPSHELQNADDRALWFAGYTRTYLERDLSELSTVASLVDFRRLMRAVCLRLGNVVNQTELGRDVGLPQATVHRYLNLLEASYQLVRLPAYAVNRTKRLIKAPKLYWADAGLAMHLSGEADPRGSHLENLILQELLAWSGTIIDGPQLLYWRTAPGEEVDFVVEWKGQLLPIEVKTTKKPRVDDARHLLSFRKEYKDRSRTALLLHCGTEVYPLLEGVLAAPWWKLA